MSYQKKCEELEQQLKESKAEIQELYGGRLGACHTCEQVAELNIKLEQQIKEAERVINMVEDNRKMPHHHKDYYERLCCLSERAREYKDKYKVKE